MKTLLAGLYVKPLILDTLAKTTQGGRVPNRPTQKGCSRSRTLSQSKTNLLPVRRPPCGIHDLMRLVHMPNCPVTQPARRWHILRPGQIVVRRGQQLIRLPEPVMRAQVRVDVERIVQPLPV